jgi:hypothetical protein
MGERPLFDRRADGIDFLLEEDFTKAQRVGWTPEHLLDSLPTQQAIGDMVVSIVLSLVGGSDFVLFVGTDVEGEALEDLFVREDLRHGRTLLVGYSLIISRHHFLSTFL